MHGSRWPRGEERSWEGSTSSGCTGWDLAAECGSWLTLWIELPLIGYWWNCRGVWCIAEWKQFLSPFPFYGMHSRVSIQAWQLIRMGAPVPSKEPRPWLSSNVIASMIKTEIWRHHHHLDVDEIYFRINFKLNWKQDLHRTLNSWACIKQPMLVVGRKKLDIY